MASGAARSLASGHRADAHLCHQLDGHAGLRIRVLEVEDQLRQILDRINVVVRRRRDQLHPRRRIPKLGNVFVDFVSGQLTAFAGLGALRHLDLQFTRIH